MATRDPQREQHWRALLAVAAVRSQRLCFLQTAQPPEDHVLLLATQARLRTLRIVGLTGRGGVRADDARGGAGG